MMITSLGIYFPTANSWESSAILLYWPGMIIYVPGIYSLLLCLIQFGYISATLLVFSGSVTSSPSCFIDPIYLNFVPGCLSSPCVGWRVLNAPVPAPGLMTGYPATLMNLCCPHHLSWSWRRQIFGETVWLEEYILSTLDLYYFTLYMWLI